MNAVCEALAQLPGPDGRGCTGAAVPRAVLRPPQDAAATIEPSWRRTTGDDVQPTRGQGLRRGLVAAAFATLLVGAALVLFVLPRLVTATADRCGAHSEGEG